MTAVSPKGIIDELKRQYQEQALEDPLVRWFEKNSNKIFWIIVAVFAAFYLRGVYLDTQLTSRRESADTYAQVRSRFDDWTAALVAEKEEERKTADQKKAALEESIKALSDTKEPYRSLAPLYTSLVALKSNSTLVPPSLEATSKNELNKLTSELEALAIARTGLDKQEKREESLGLLKKLVQKSDFVAAPAAAILADLSVSEDEKAETKKLINDLIAARPELSKILKESVDKL